jgi:carbonic anhydrase
LLDELLERNRRFAEGASKVHEKLPRRGLLILTCMDHRVDPAAAFGLEVGDAMVIRNAGGRVTPGFLRDLEILNEVAARRGGSLGDLELFLLQHTQCGAGGLAGERDDLLAAQFEVSSEQIGSKATGDPREAIRVDMEALAASAAAPGSLAVTGLLYDVNTGRADLIERRAPLRDSG